MNHAKPNRLYWFRRGTRQKILGRVVSVHREWLNVEVFASRRRAWLAPAMLHLTRIIEPADARAYPVQYALTLADPKLKAALFGLPLKKGRRA